MKGREEQEATPDSVTCNRRARTRRLIRWACLVAVVGMLWSAGTARWTGVVPALSPWIAAASMLATWTFHSLAWLGWAVGAISLFRLRWFCRWVCPTGLCADGSTWLGRRRKHKPLRVPFLGQWIVWLTLGGAFLGYPVLLWLDPLALFSGFFRVSGADMSLTAWLSALGLPLVLLLSLLWPNSWCGRVCPLGAFQDVLFSVTRLLRWVVSRGQGTGSPRQWGPPLARRAVLGAGIGAALAFMVRRRRASMPRPLRPPGALGEPEFSGVCVRCGNCSRACPTGIIESDLGEHGIASLLTPMLSFRSDYCREDCTRCMDVCPSGALERWSLENKHEMRLGFPHVDMSLCLLGDDRECAECRNRCPYEAVRYAWSESEYSLAPYIDPTRCTGCGACEVACPTRPRRAIIVVPVSPSQ